VVERVVGALIGVVFGVVLSWTALIDPDTIRFGLLFEDLYLILVFAAAVTTAFVGSQVLRRLHPRVLVNRERVEWMTERPERRHLTGAALFGTAGRSPARAPARSPPSSAGACGGACSPSSAW